MIIRINSNENGYWSADINLSEGRHCIYLGRVDSNGNFIEASPYRNCVTIDNSYEPAVTFNYVDGDFNTEATESTGGFLMLVFSVSMVSTLCLG